MVRPSPAHRASGIVAWGLLLILAQLVLRGWALWGSWFYFDDLAFTSRALNQSFDGSYLFESYGGHLMPAGFALVWVLTKVAVYEWWVWAVVLIMMQAVASLGLLRLLRSMFGDRRSVLVLLAGYLCTALTLPASIWFAAGINQLPLQIALVFGLHAHIQYLRTRSWHSLAATLAWTLAGLLFYEKTALLFGVYALVAACWFGHGNTPERLLGLWTAYRTGIIAHAVVAGTYLAIYAAVGLNFSPGGAQSQPLTPITWNLVFVALIPALVGGPLTWQPIAVGSFANPSQLVQLASWLAVGSLVYYAHRTRTLSKRAWSLVAWAVLANVLLLASARANIVGPDIAREFRYQTECALLFVLSAGLAFLPLLRAPVRNDVREGVPRTYETPRFVAAAAAVVAVLSVVSSVRYVNLWQDRNPTAAYYRQVVRSLANTGKKPVPIVDGGIPNTMLWAFRYPENTYSHVFRNLAGQTSYPKVSLDRLFDFDDKGRLRPVEVPQTRVLLPSVGCGYSMKGETKMTLPLNGPVIGGGWWVRMGYQSDRSTRLEITAGDEHHEVTVPGGLHALYFRASGQDFDRITLEGNHDGADLCVGEVSLGLPQPGGASS